VSSDNTNSSPLAPRLIIGDARQQLALFPPNHFDAVITDPPYNIRITKRDADRPNWDNTKIVGDMAFWAEVHRVLKPGGNLIAFGHSRTWARMAVAIEDGGFAIVDSLAWVHGQGYPAGHRGLDADLTRVGADDLASDYAGYGSMLRPGFEPIVAARKLRRNESLAKIIADGGSGGFNLDASRIPAGDEDRSRIPGRVSAGATWRVHRAARQRSSPPPAGRMPSNVLLEHPPGCTQAGCDPSCPVDSVHRDGRAVRGRGEDATRFYTVLHHPAASPAERPQIDGVGGPTVKPLGVMDWLVRLATRPGQLVLDPFAGTGTTLEACFLAGVRSVGIEQIPEYGRLTEKRLQRAGAFLES
jgi:hypothetical protein